MNITMRISHLAACCLVALAPGLACAAISLAPPSLSPCAFADTESSSNFVFCTGTGLDRNWILAIEADVSSNNNVQVEFGVDRDGDGALSVDERELTVGWDCGEWVLRDRRGDVERRAAERPEGRPSARPGRGPERQVGGERVPRRRHFQPLQPGVEHGAGGRPRRKAGGRGRQVRAVPPSFCAEAEVRHR